MTVLSFPDVKRQRSALGRREASIYLIAVLRLMGEPATLAELSAVVREASGHHDDWTDAFLGSVLETLRETGFDDIPGVAVLRVIDLAGGSAWAFTQTFRAMLRVSGMPTALRSVPL